MEILLNKLLNPLNSVYKELKNFYEQIKQAFYKSAEIGENVLVEPLSGIGQKFG